MTGEIEPRTESEQEQEVIRPVCEVSAAAARQLLDPLLEHTGDPDSVLYRTMNDRAARMTQESRLGLSHSLLVDPTRRGKAPRYMQQTGAFTEESPIDTPEAAVVLWTAASRADIPKLRVPQGSERATMDLADQLQMRGGGPIIFSREEVAGLPVTADTQVIVHGAAKRAMIERFESALKYREAGYNGVILATADSSRLLKDSEKKAVEDFAADATNEYELMLASAMHMGFVFDTGSRFGALPLPDGSLKVDLIHPERGAKIMVLAAARHEGKNGVYNTYQALLRHGKEIIGSDFALPESDLVHVTSTHYGPMVVMNNLRAVDSLRTSLRSIHVLGDNRPLAARPELAHLIEAGYVYDAGHKAINQSLSLRNALLSTDV